VRNAVFFVVSKGDLTLFYIIPQWTHHISGTLGRHVCHDLQSEKPRKRWCTGTKFWKRSDKKFWILLIYLVPHDRTCLSLSDVRRCNAEPCVTQQPAGFIHLAHVAPFSGSSLKIRTALRLFFTPLIVSAGTNARWPCVWIYGRSLYHKGSRLCVTGIHGRRLHVARLN
jgi:hypothetical protein